MSDDIGSGAGVWEGPSRGGQGSRGGWRSRGGRGSRGSWGSCASVVQPMVESFYIGKSKQEQSSDLTQCVPHERPLHPKRPRLLEFYEVTDAIVEAIDDMPSATSPITVPLQSESASALPLPPQSEVLPPSPAAFVTSGGSVPSTPSMQWGLTDEQIEHFVNYGSDDDSAEESDEDALIPTFIPRTSRMFIDTGDDDDDEYDDLSQAQMSGSAPASSESAPASATSSSSVEAPLEDTYRPRALFDWESFPSVPAPCTARRETFRGVEVGPTAVFPSPYEAFVAIWTREFMQKIVDETNRYAQQNTQLRIDVGNLRPTSRITLWQDVDVDELYVYFALLLETGLCPKGDVKEYWSKDDFTSSSMFGRYMTYNRFILLSSCLHFVDNEIDIRTLTRPQARAAKIQPVIEHLNSRFQALYDLSQNITTDESLTQWRGWLSFKQLIKTKAAGVGLKTCELCDSRTGYLWRFQLYSGREEETRGEAPVSGCIANLVLDLLKGLENKGHTVWMDNFYNSPALARVMKSLGFDCAGTLRTNRQDVPLQLKNLKMKDMTRGQIYGSTSGDVDILVWRDAKRLAMISTFHGAGFHTVRGKMKPTVVYDYNVCMGGVDKKDQMLSAYPIERKRTRVWYKKLFRRLLNVSVLNALILHRDRAVPNSQPHISNHRVFRKTLVHQLLDKHHKPRVLSVPTNNRDPSAPKLSQEVMQHFPRQYGYEPGKKGRTRHRCIVCHKRQYTYCPACNVPLCIDECTRKYHGAS